MKAQLRMDRQASMSGGNPLMDGGGGGGGGLGGGMDRRKSIDQKFEEKRERRMSSNASSNAEQNVRGDLAAAMRVRERRGSMEMKFANRQESQKQELAVKSGGGAGVLGNLQARIEGIFKSSKSTASKPTFQATARAVSGMNGSALAANSGIYASAGGGEGCVSL
jgi:hypothetical protein